MIDDRFKRLHVDISKISLGTPPKQLYDQLPSLKRYFTRPYEQVKKLEDLPEKVMSWPLDLAKVIRYIVLMYDPETPLNTEYPEDLQLRKEAAAKEAGFNRDEQGEWPDGIVEMMELKSDMIVDWILDFLAVVKQPVHSSLRLIEEELWALNRSRMEAVRDGNISSSHLTLTKERLKERDILLKRFFAENADLQDVGEKKLFPVSPENVFGEIPQAKDTWRMRQIRDVIKNVPSPS